MSEEHCNDSQIETNCNKHESQRDIVEVHIRKHNDWDHEEVVNAKGNDQQLLMREVFEEASHSDGCTNGEDDGDDAGCNTNNVHGLRFVDMLLTFFSS